MGELHGARSPERIRVVSRRVLRRSGLRRRDLEPIGRALLDNYARSQSKVELLDAYFAEHGFLDTDGIPVPAVKVYFTALNSARHALSKLAEHFAEVGHDEPLAVLEGEGRRIRLAVEEGDEAA